MANIHDKEDLSNDYKSNSGSQITQNMPRKYSILPGIKILQDRLQDMYTNRSDTVNATGDGWAAAHQNEVKEIMWVYLKCIGVLAGFHGVVLAIPLGFLGFIYSGIFFETSHGLIGGFFLLLSLAVISRPFGLLTYAEMITEDSRKYVVGENTKQFFESMKTSMSNISSSVWMLSAGSFIGMFFLVGLLEKPMISFMSWIFKHVLFMPIDSPSLKLAIFNNGSVYGMMFFATTMVAIFITRTLILDRVKQRATALSIEHKKTQAQYKNKDSVQEARELFK